MGDGNNRSNQPVPGEFDSWNAYWTAQGMPWRTEPQINDERQRFLAEQRAIPSDSKQGVYPFKDIKLSRADVEWLLATHESGGKVGPVLREEEQSKPQDQWRWGLDLRGADLQQTNLTRLPLARTRGGPRHTDLDLLFPEQPELELPEVPIWTEVEASSGVHLEEADLREACLEHAELIFSHLSGANLQGAHMQGVQLAGTSLEEVGLSLVHMEGAFLFAANLQPSGQGVAIGAHFERADLRYALLGNRIMTEAHLEDADLRGASFTDTTVLNGAWLGSEVDGVARLADIKWRGANLAQVRWVGVTHILQPQSHRIKAGPVSTRVVHLLETRRILRASRQLAVALRDQGLNEQADHFAYQAQVYQRRVNRLRRQPLRYLGSWLLDLISGYGYRPLRSFITYLLVVLSFAAAYFALGGANGQPLAWNEAIVVSVTAFHGRGFFSSVFQPGDLQAAVAAVEAFLGLLIEIVFIATFTQRFFAR
jgi:uncharacterized protein YjbI with pentapeptide repeats